MYWLALLVALVTVANCRKRDAAGQHGAVVTDIQGCRMKTKAQRCKPFTEVRRGCFTCLCLFSELIDPKLCTRKYCDKRGEPVVGAPCRPGAVFHQGDCVKCTCTDNGTIDASHCSYICDYNGAVIDQFATCTPGTIFNYGCNHCICTSRGTVDWFSCSLRHCNMAVKLTAISGKMSDIKTLTLSDLDIDNVCEPGSFIKVRCNLCVCSDDGLIFPDRCTRMKCPQYSYGDSCIPGERFRNGCFACFCPDKGIVDKQHCSNKYCNDFGRRRMSPQARGPQTGDRCKPGVSFKSGCRLCKCPPSGRIDLTLCLETKECSEDKDNPQTITATNMTGRISTVNEHDCIPQTLFKLGCKTCICPASGTLFLAKCTDNGCTEIPPTTNGQIQLNGILIKVQKLPKNGEPCVANKHYQYNCTVCYCAQSGIINTQLCIQNACNISQDLRTRNEQSISYTAPLKKEGDGCTANATYQHGCSTCFCPADGKVDLTWCTGEECKFEELPITSSENSSCLNQATNSNCSTAVAEVETKLHSDNNTNCIGDACNSVQALEKMTMALKCPANKTFLLTPCVKCQCPETGIEDLSRCERIQDMHCNNRRTEGISPVAPELPIYGTPCEVADLIQFVCNYCRCPAEGYIRMDMCTRFVCTLSKPEKVGDPCHIGSLFYLHCNLCRCGSTGIVNLQLCTNKICGIAQDAKATVLSTDTTPTMLQSTSGSSNSLPSKEKSRSLKLNEEDATAIMRCIPNTIYKDQCNYCMCSLEGFKDRSLCTNDVCTTTNKVNKINERSSIVSMFTSKYTIGLVYNGMPCIPKYIYKWECNFCTCPQEGFITERYCTNIICSVPSPVLKSINEDYEPVTVRAVIQNSTNPSTVTPKRKIKRYRNFDNGTFDFWMSRRNWIR